MYLSNFTNILLQYMHIKTVPTENPIKTKEIKFSLFNFHINYIVDRPDVTALAGDKQYGGKGDLLNYG